MSKTVWLGMAGLVVAAGALAAGYVAGRDGPAVAQEPSQIVAAASTNGNHSQMDRGQIDRGEIETIVRDYLMKNPEIIFDMQQAYEDKQREEQRVASQQTISEAEGDIFNAAYDGYVGNPNGTTTIVEFYDYNCGYCKRAQEDMTVLTSADPDLRFVLKEFPILGPDSTKAHIVSMAFRALIPEKYADFHNQLIGASGRATEDSAIELALSLGADEARLREEMRNPAIGEAFEKTYELANRLSITGTPSYVIGSEVVFGAIGHEALAQKIAESRAATGEKASN